MAMDGQVEKDNADTNHKTKMRASLRPDVVIATETLGKDLVQEMESEVDRVQVIL